MSAHLNDRLPPNPGQPRQRAMLNENQLAKRWNVSEKKLQKERLTGKGVPFLKLGRSIRYQLEAIEAFEAACLRNSTSDMGPVKGANDDQR